jgi:hypothetical protein
MFLKPVLRVEALKVSLMPVLWFKDYVSEPSLYITGMEFEMFRLDLSNEGPFISVKDVWPIWSIVSFSSDSCIFLMSDY